MKDTNRKSGFTLVELLTVMSVIAILIGLLAPALNLVRDIATETKQKAQFHAIAVALDIYKGEMEEYPDSAAVPASSSPYTVGAQHLAAALVGRDLLGYDPDSTYDADADAGIGDIYDSVKASLERRKGPYLNPENTEAFQLGQLYSNTNDVYDSNSWPAPVLTDAYRIKKISIALGSSGATKSFKVGSPILYYKANTSSLIFPDYDDTVSDADAQDGIYNSIDNEDIIALGSVKDDGITAHEFDGAVGRTLFYNKITNPKIANVARPYNQTSYILISAGKDGIYGTSDDIFNFND